MVIGNTEYEVTEELLDQCQLLYYVENPRVYSILRANGESAYVMGEIVKSDLKIEIC
jgi:hypothetical protein